MNGVEPSTGRRLLITVALVLTCSQPGAAPALQDAPGPAAEEGPPLADDAPVEGLRPDNLHPNVYLHDNSEAEELIAKGVRQAAAGRWQQAARKVHHAVVRHSDKLTRSDPGLYTNIPQRVNRLVASWPPEGLAAYRELAEPQARRRLIEARQDRRIEPLLVVAQRYFCTDAGARAASLVAELALEAGDFSLSVAMLRRLLTEHPDRQRFRLDVTTRLAVVHALWGRAKAARRYAADAGQEAAVEWMGRRRPLTPLVESLLAEVRPAAGPSTRFDWPTFAGNPQRHLRTDLSVDQLAVLWQVDGVGLAASLSESDQSGSFRRALRQGRLLSMNPVLAANTLYVQDDRSVWALQVSSGTLLWQYTGVGESSSQTTMIDSDVPRWHAVAAADSRVFACLGSEILPYYGYEVPENTSALVCLEAGSGDLLWRADRASLGTTFDEMSFESTPIVADGKLYVVVRRKRTFGFEDAFLYRLDAAAGTVDFRVHLGSASTGGFGYRRPTLTIPSLLDSTVYVVTNLGTIAAVDRHTGSVRWLRLYERISEGQWRREGRGASREVSPWQYNPLVCADGRIYALPTDSESLLVLDRASGRIEHDVPIRDLFNVQTLLGVEGSRIYGVGDQAFCYDLASGSHVWQSALPEDGQVLGRGVLTERQCLVPMRSALCAVDRETGVATVQAWEALESGGNLLAVPGQLIVAGNDRVTAYARKADVLGRLRARMERQPGDPRPALDLAEVLFRTGDTAESLVVLDQAIARAGGFAGPIEGEVKRRLFDDCLSFAEKLARDEDFQLETAVGLYERASQCAPDARAHLTYRFGWARLYEGGRRWDEAMALYQQILADRSLARAEYAEGSAEPRRAGLLAESAVSRLILERGRQVYAPFDLRASEWLAAGRTSGDLELLDSLLETYPNSLAAPEAHKARAELLRRRGRPIEAARSLHAALSAHGKQTDRPALMRQIADCYRDAGRPRHAWRWLTKAASEYPTATVEADGRRLTLLEYRAGLGNLQGQVEPSRPRLVPPLTETYSREFDQACYLLDPRFEEVPQTDWSTLLIHTGGAVQAYDVQANCEVWPEAATCPVRPDLLFTTSERAVLATRHRIFCLDARTGRQLWQYGRRPPELDDPETDPEDFAVFVSFAVADGTLVALRSDGQAAALEVQSGRCRWERHLDHRPAGPMVVSDAWIVYQTTHLGRSVYAVLATADGTGPVRLIDPRDDRPIARMFISLADRVLLVTSETVHCYDLPLPDAPLIKGLADGAQIWSLQRDDGILAGGVALDLDGLYLPDENLRIEKVSLADGRTIWQSESPDSRAWRGSEGVSVHLLDGQLLVSTERRVIALGGRDGRILWEGTVRRGTRFRHRLVTDSFLVALDSPPEHFEEPRTAFFYDLGDGSGIIPSDGGVKPLGVFEDVKAVTVRDGALILQAGRTVHVWTSKPRP